MLDISCPNIAISDHLPTVGVRLYKQPLNVPKSHKYITYRSYKNLNESEFLKTLSETPWDSAFVFEDVDDIVDAWYCLFNEAVNIHMPLKKKRVKYDTQPTWLTSELLELIKSRDQKLKKAKYSNLPEDWLDLKRTKNKVIAQLDQTKRNSFINHSKKTVTIPKNSGLLLDISRGEIRTQINAAVFLEENNEHIRDPSQMTEIFNNHFSNLTKHLIDDKINAYDPDVLSKLVSKLNLTTKMVFLEMTTQQTLEFIQAISTN